MGWAIPLGCAIYLVAGVFVTALCKAAARGDARADVASMRAEQRRRDALAHLTDEQVSRAYWQQVCPDHPVFRGVDE